MKTKFLSFIALLCLVTLHLFAQGEEIIHFSDGIITVGDYSAFLNDVAANDPKHLDETEGWRDARENIITRSGKPGGYHYDVIAENKNLSMTGLSRFDATRYCNWKINNDLSSNPDFSCSSAEAVTEYGAYKLQGDQLFSINSEATYVVLNNSKCDPLLKSNLLTFSVVKTDATASQAGGAEVAVGDELLEEFIMDSLALISVELGVEAGKKPEVANETENTLRSPESLMLQKFREAAVHPDNVRANRLFIDDRTHVIQASSATEKNSGKIRSDNLFIIEQLKTALQAEAPLSDINKIINEELPKSGFISSRPFLSSAKLSRVLEKANKARVKAQAASTTSERSARTVIRDPSGDSMFSKLMTAVKKVTGLGKEKLPLPIQELFFGALTSEKLIAKARDAIRDRSKIKEFLEVLITRDRGTAAFDAHYQLADSLHQQAEEAWACLFKTWKGEKIQKEVAKQFCTLLISEKERLAQLEGKTLGDILLEKYKSNTDMMFSGVDPLILGASIQTELGMLFSSNISQPLETLNTIIALPDISFSGATGAFYSVLKWAILKQSQIAQDALVEQLANIDQEQQQLKEQAEDTVKKASRLRKEAQEEEKRAQDKDLSVTKEFAKAIKAPFTHDPAAWEKWAKDVASWSEMNGHDIVEWISLFVTDHSHDVPNMVSTAWRKRMNDSDVFLEHLITSKEEEMTQFRKWLDDAERKEATTKEVSESHQMALEELTQARTALEKEHQTVVQNLQALVLRGPANNHEQHESDIRTHSEKISNFQTRLDTVREDYPTRKQVADDMSIRAAVAQAVAQEIAKIYKNSEERYDRAISRALIRGKADREAWEESWPELHFKEIAKKIAEAQKPISEVAWLQFWKEAMTLCVEGSYNWAKQADKIEVAFQKAAKLANTTKAILTLTREGQQAALIEIPETYQELRSTAIAAIKKTEDEEANWAKKAVMAEANSCAAKKPKTLKAKIAFANAKKAWSDFSKIVTQLKHHIDDHILVATAVESVAAARDAAGDAASYDTRFIYDAPRYACEGISCISYIILSKADDKFRTNCLRLVHMSAGFAIIAAMESVNSIWADDANWAAHVAHEADNICQAIVSWKRAESAKPWWSKFF